LEHLDPRHVSDEQKQSFRGSIDASNLQEKLSTDGKLAGKRTLPPCETSQGVKRVRSEEEVADVVEAVQDTLLELMHAGKYSFVGQLSAEATRPEAAPSSWMLWRAVKSAKTPCVPAATSTASRRRSSTTSSQRCSTSWSCCARTWPLQLRFLATAPPFGSTTGCRIACRQQLMLDASRAPPLLGCRLLQEATVLSKRSISLIGVCVRASLTVPEILVEHNKQTSHLRTRTRIIVVVVFRPLRVMLLL